MIKTELRDGKERMSGIELLKIVAILMIILSHCIQTLCSENTYINYQGYVLDLASATTNVQSLTLSIMYCSTMGNIIFILCSFWFLLDSKQTRLRKIFHMLADVWVISVVLLVFTWATYDSNISATLALKSLFPTTFSNNWFLTCYMLFYLLHQYLNKIIYGMSQKNLLRCCLVLGGLYIFVNFFISGLFFCSTLISWVTLYFCVAYMKLYLKEIASSKKMNILFVVIGLGGTIGIMLLTNFLGLRFSLFQNKLLHWKNTYSPFLILAATGLFNLARRARFSNRAVNTISSLSLLIYIIHENLLLRTYYRPFAINYIYETFGYDHIILWVFLLVILIFIGSLIVSMLYKMTIQKLTVKVSNKLYNLATRAYRAVELLLLRIH